MKYQIIAGLLLLGLGYVGGRYVQPAKVVTQTQVITHDIIHEHDHIVTQTITLPNGTKTTTTTVDKNKNEQASSDTNSSTVTTYSKPGWKVQGLAGLNVNNIDTPVYGIDVEKRILGPIFIGAYGKTDKEVGLSLSVEF